MMDRPDACEVCGNRQLESVDDEGRSLWRCGLCDHLHGNAEVIERIALREEADERGFHPLVYPLVKALETVPTFRVAQASAGRPDASEYPFVFLRVSEGGLADVENLLTSLELANRATQRRWVVECALQRGLLFIVRPRFWKAIQDITSDDVAESRADLQHLAEAVGRDVKLSWWRGG